MRVMYKGIPNSPRALIQSPIAADTTTITISNREYLPDAPNLAVLGVGEASETILYTVKNGAVLSGITRGVQGVATSWAAGTTIARNFTEADYDALLENILTLNADKLALDGYGSDVTVGFTQAASRSNLVSGEKLSGLFSKLGKWFTDFGSLAWLSKVGNDEINDGAVTNSKLDSMQRNTLKGNNTENSVQPKDLTAAEVRSLLNIEDGADSTSGAISSAGAGSISDNDKIPFSSSGTLKSLSYSALKSFLNALYADIRHASSHAAGGADALTPAAIGALEPAVILSKTLTAAAWNSGSQVISDAKINAGSIGDLKISQGASAEQFAAWAACLPQVTSQAAGSITVTARGEVPLVSIPVVLEVRQ